MLDYAQSFEEFSSSLKPMDLALYAGIGIILWVLFKDKLSPVQIFVANLLNKLKSSIKTTNESTTAKPVVVSVTKPDSENTDVFFDLVVSWKQTRDLAVRSGCSEAVKVADQMFPHLSPTVCGEKKL